MKHFLLLLFFLPCIAFGQTTAIPDTAFEQALIDLGYDTGTPNGSVPTANIDTLRHLDISGCRRISDLSGIQDFKALEYLDCKNIHIDIRGKKNTGILISPPFIKNTSLYN